MPMGSIFPSREVEVPVYLNLSLPACVTTTTALAPLSATQMSRLPILSDEFGEKTSFAINLFGYIVVFFVKPWLRTSFVLSEKA